MLKIDKFSIVFPFNNYIVDDNSIKNLINELGDKISNNPIPEGCEKIKIYYGDKNSEGEWDEFIVSCEINL